MPAVKFGSVMMWGAMSLHGCGVLTKVTGWLNGEGYIDILGDALLASAHLLGYGDHFFQQEDNAFCHRARIVQEWKADQGFQMLEWPPRVRISILLRIAGKT